jgi:hypothetical protein
MEASSQLIVVIHVVILTALTLNAPRGFHEDSSMGLHLLWYSTFSLGKFHMAQISRGKTAKPSSSKEMAISKCVEDVGIDDTVLEIYGPTQLAESVVWEIWVKDQEGHLATRFVEECADGKNNVFDTFQQLAVRLNAQHQEIMKQLAESQWEKTRQLTELQLKSSAEASKSSNERIEHLVKLGMALGGFTVSPGLAVFLALHTDQLGAWPATFVILCIAATGTYFVYG